MNTARISTNQVESMTFTCRIRSRGDVETGPSDLEYTDTIYANGDVLTTVIGYEGGERVNQSKRHDRRSAVADWRAIERARASQGWRRIA